MEQLKLNYYQDNNNQNQRPTDTGEDTTTYGREFDESQFGRSKTNKLKK